MALTAAPSAVFFIAASQPFVASQRRRFGHTGKFDGKFSSHNKLVAKGVARSVAQGKEGIIDVCAELPPHKDFAGWRPYLSCSSHAIARLTAFFQPL